MRYLRWVGHPVRSVRHRWTMWRFPPRKRWGEASFAQCIRRRRRLQWAMCDGNFPFYGVETKLGGKALAETLGIRTPALLQGPHARLQDIDWAALPDSFVVKPDAGKSTKGVLVVQREGETFRELLSGRCFAADDLEAMQRRLDRGLLCPQRYPDIFVEQALLQNGRPALDWKLYVIGGRVMLVEQIERHPSETRHRMYDEEFVPVGRIHRKTRFDDSLLPPEKADQLRKTATQVAEAIRTPFVRVDLYEVDGVIYFGELTLRPGDAHQLRPEWDRRLGEAWERAEAALLRTVDAEAYMP